ncbi:MAG: hypothetical protein Q4G10_04595 [Bacteroidia bacterium]|nr:hypothetical protein [Bacteroidia bacterium]
MRNLNERNLDFVVKHYQDGKFDTKKAIDRINSAEKTALRFRWLTTAAAVAASVVIVFAAGYGLTTAIRHSKSPAEKAAAQTVLNPDVATTHEFVYDGAPLDDVLTELSDYFDCTLTVAPTEKCLTATFPDDDIDLIVSIIESVLDVDITVAE